MATKKSSRKKAAKKASKKANKKTSKKATKKASKKSSSKKASKKATKKVAKKASKKATKKPAKKAAKKPVAPAAPARSVAPTTSAERKHRHHNRIAAGIFGIVLGGLGIHKFYMGKIGWGVLYLIFFWTMIPSLVGFIEGILYLTATDDEFYDKYV